MKIRGIKSIGALFLVLLFLTGALVVHPNMSAQAQGKRIQGIVYDASNLTKVFSASVTLTDVHSLANTTTTTVGNTYEFIPSPGYYMIRVKANGYFEANTTQPFRYDGTKLLQFDFPLDKYPDRDETLSVLVTEAEGATWTEDPYFPRYTVTENVAANFTTNPPQNHTTVKYKPLVRIKGVRWTDLTTPSAPPFPPITEFTVIDQWLGTVTVNNVTISNALNSRQPDQRSPPYYLNFTYTYTSITAQLNHTPVVPNSYAVYKNSINWMAQKDTDWIIDENVGTVTILQNFTWGIDRLNMTWDSTGVISGALVTFYNTTRKQVIDTPKLTDSNGLVQFAVWAGDWEVWTSKYTYETNVTSKYISDSETLRVLLRSAIIIIGYASNSESYIRDDVVAFLYNRDPAVPFAKKVLRATVENSQFLFRAYPGPYWLIVDAPGHESNVTALTIGSTSIAVGTIFLNISKEERLETAMIFNETSWNNLTIYRNYSFNRDSIISGLDPFDLRDASLQIDYTLGNRNGIVDATEWNAFKLWWQKNGPLTVDSNGLMFTNSLMYLSNYSDTTDRANTQYTVQTTQRGYYPIWINDTAWYYTKGSDLVPDNRSQYYLNFTGAWDTNTTAYHNNTYIIDLPHRYELTETTFRSPGLQMKNFTRIELDPEIGSGFPRADMIIRKSANGTARARVKGPAGHFQELNSTLENYTAVVMANYNITYSADQSFDPIGRIQDANFTWNFTGPNSTRWGMDVEFNYTSYGEYKPTLTIVEAGGNVTFREFTILVDDQAPTAHLWTNRSIGDSDDFADGTTIRINETVSIQIDAARSKDFMFGNKEGTIAEAHWDFDGNGIEDGIGVTPPGIFVNHSYETPGNYTLYMWVKDSVGHRSTNASMYFIVNDTTPPVVDFVVYDSEDNPIDVQSLMEGKEFRFNASRTMDNYDAIENLTFTWDFGDNTTNVSGKGLQGYYVNHTYSVFNNTYYLRLNVTDQGFFGKQPNYRVLERVITVMVDTTKRPNLVVEQGSFTAIPGDPEEGTDTVISFSVKNDANRGSANNVGVKLLIRSGATFTTTGISSVRFYDEIQETSNSIPSGEKRRVEFVWNADVAGARILKVVVSDPDEPYTWVSDNSIESTIDVREAGWKMPVIIGVIVFLIFGVPIIYYLVKKYRAGELRLPKREKPEKPEKPEKKEAAPEKKEKKRL